MIEMCGDPVRDLPCMQLDSYVKGSPLLWMTLLHLHVNLYADDNPFLLFVTLYPTRSILIAFFDNLFG